MSKVAATGRPAPRRCEPAILRRGRAFHRRVQEDWSRSAGEQPVEIERIIKLLPSAAAPARRQRGGRIDVFIDLTGDYVTVVEIKSTDWNLVKPGNRRRLLSAHRRQVFKYVDTYVDRDHVWVCAGIIYPRPPQERTVRDEIEEYLNGNAIQVVWYDD